jgi:hypothetical protein
MDVRILTSLAFNLFAFVVKNLLTMLARKEEKAVPAV